MKLPTRQGTSSSSWTIMSYPRNNKKLERLEQSGEVHTDRRDSVQKRTLSPLLEMHFLKISPVRVVKDA